MAAPLKLVIEMSDDGVATGLKVVSKNVEGSAQEMRRSLGAIGSGAKEASPHLEGFTDKFRGFVAEERQQNRMAGFLATQISEMGFASKSAAGAVTQLLSAFAFGGGLGVVIEGAKMLVEAWHESGEAAKKATEDAVKSLTALHEKVLDYIATLNKETESEKLRRKEIGPLREEELRQYAAQEQKAEEVGRLTAELHEVEKKRMDPGPLRVRIDMLAGELRILQDQLVATRALMKAKEGEIGTVAGREREEREAKGAAQIAAVFGEMAQQQIDWAAKADEEIRRIAEERRERDKQLLAEGLRDQLKAAEDQQAADIQMLKDEERIQDEFAARHKAKIHEITATAQPFAHAFQSAFTSIISGAKSLDDAMADLGKGILIGIVDQFIQMAIASIAASIVSKKAALSTTQGYIAEAVAGAAASVAFIPVVGPFLAEGAAQAMAGTLEGLTGPMLSAAGGFDVPAGVNPVVRIHEREMVLPRAEADVVRGLAGDGGTDGVHLHVHSVYADSDGIRRMLNDPRFAHEFREAARRGRLR